MMKTHSIAMRMLAGAGSLTLVAALVAAPVALGGDTPEETLGELEVALEAKDLDAIPSLFCAEQADALGGLGITELLEEAPPFILELLLDAFVVEVDFESSTVISQSDTEAVVDVVGSMSTEIDMEALAPLLESIFDLTGEEPGPGGMEAAIAAMAGDIPEADTVNIVGEITLVTDESGAWLVCSTLPIAPGTVEDDMAEDDMEDEDGE